MRTFAIAAAAVILLCGISRAATPEQRALIRAFDHAVLLGREHAGDGDQSVTNAAVAIHDDVWRALELSGLCYGDDRASRSTPWVWGKCGPHSLHPGAYQLTNDF